MHLVAILTAATLLLPATARAESRPNEEFVTPLPQRTSPCTGSRYQSFLLLGMEAVGLPDTIDSEKWPIVVQSADAWSELLAGPLAIQLKGLDPDFPDDRVVLFGLGGERIVCSATRGSACDGGLLVHAQAAGPENEGHAACAVLFRLEMFKGGVRIVLSRE